MLVFDKKTKQCRVDLSGEVRPPPHRAPAARASQPAPRAYTYEEWLDLYYFEVECILDGFVDAIMNGFAACSNVRHSLDETGFRKSMRRRIYETSRSRFKGQPMYL